MGQAAATSLVLVVMGTLIFAGVLASRAMFVRALRDVVALLRERGATSRATAVTLDELGIPPRNPFALSDPSMKLRDYRPDALRLLARADIVKATDEGELYLSEDDLRRSRVRELAHIE